MNVSVVVLACPNVAAFSLDDLGDHVINESVLVPELSAFEVLPVDGFVKILEDVLEPTIILLEDCVLGGHVEGIVALKSVLEASMGKGLNGVVVIEHEKSHS